MTAYERIQTMPKDEMAIFLRNIYFMGIMDERRGTDFPSMDFHSNIPNHYGGDVDRILTLCEVFDRYSIIHTPAFGNAYTFGFFNSWEDAFQHISNNSNFELVRIAHSVFRSGYETYEIIKL